MPCLAVAFLAYFGFHAVNGDLGLDARAKLETKRSKMQDELAELVSRRESLEHRARLMKDGTIEKDMLDQQAREMLDVARPDEIVIYR